MLGAESKDEMTGVVLDTGGVDVAIDKVRLFLLSMLRSIASCVLANSRTSLRVVVSFGEESGIDDTDALMVTASCNSMVCRVIVSDRPLV